MAGRGPAFKSEEAGGPKTAREPRRKNPEGGERKQLPKHVDGPEELKQRRHARRMRRRNEYKKTAGDAKKDEGELASASADAHADGVLLKAIEALRQGKEDQANEIAGLRTSLIEEAKRSEKLAEDLETAKAWAASMPSAEEVPKLEADVQKLKQKLEEARLEVGRLKQNDGIAKQSDDSDRAPLQIEDKPAAASATG